MKFKISLIASAVIGLALFGASSGHAQLTTGQVYEVSLNGSFVQTQAINENEDVVAKGSFTTANIINLALGRSTDATVPANEKLALVFIFAESGDPDAELVVFDTTGQSNLVVISTLDLGGAVDSAKGRGIVAMAGAINETGNLTGGWIALTGKVTVNNATPDSQIAAFSASAVQGVLRGTDNLENFEVIFTKGKAAVVNNLGLVAIPII